MDGSCRFIVTVTDGRNYVCLLFSKESAAKLYRACRAFAFDDMVHYRVNLPKFRNRIKKLIYSDPGNQAFTRLFSFFRNSANNRHFAVCSGDIAGSRIYLQICRTLAMHNREAIQPTADAALRILSNYDFSALGMTVRKTGPAVKGRRKCRFCGGTHPQTSFKSKAHTISEALGNKTLYTNDECDRCNARFCRTIETEFINRVAPNFPVCNIAGKNGGRKLYGKNYSLWREEEAQTTKPIILNFSDASLQRRSTDYPTDIELRAYSPARAWKPQNIYRFLCKFVIGSLDRRLLRYFGRTIEWINGQNFPEVLPKVCIEQLNHTARQPLLYIYRRQRNENLHPYMFARLHLMKYAYTFIIPFCSLDVAGLNHNGFLKRVTGLVPSVWNGWLDLNSRKKIVPEVAAFFVSGDHNILCDIEDIPVTRWHVSPLTEDYPEKAEETIPPHFAGRAAI